ncbi:MAG: leucine-rich repeat domain-containing protein, partial [Clostridia bacterium]|nr:leucine-rich repeat domain-containing protein [Clostridia bacterium]
TINIYTAEADTTYLSFESDGNGGYAVSANGGPTGEIFIPAKYNGSAGLLPVTSIGVEAFRNRTGLTGINIPNSVTSIGSSAFYYCTSLTDINIPDSVTSIGSQAFYFCSGLTTVTLGNSVSSIESSTFTHCSNLTTINIPDSVTSIGDSAFFYCTNLTDINIPDSVTSIGSRAFYRCTSLTHIFVPSTVTTISAASYSDSPFYQCSSSLVIYTGVANASSVPSGWGTYWYYYEDGKILTVKYGYSRAQYEAEVGISNTSDQSQQALANLISRRNEMKNAIVIEVMIALVIVSAGVVINLATKKKKNEK